MSRCEEHGRKLNIPVEGMEEVEEWGVKAGVWKDRGWRKGEMKSGIAGGGK